MPRRCALTGTTVRYGHNVSHSNRRTSRTFAPNLQRASLTSSALGRTLYLRVTTRALRTVQKKGGIDAFLLSTPDAKLPPEALDLKRRVRRALSGPARVTASE
jgi:large subunit ribosomal protein L28